MNTNKLVYIAVLLIVAMASCIEAKDTEKELPVVELITPMFCDTMYFGEVFIFSMKITDNTGLGNISMDLHNNFGHHNHGSHATCNFDTPKDAINPYYNSWIFTLPEDEKEYVFKTEILLPAMKNDTVQFDQGDYHFHIYVTDNDGYQVFTSLDVKVLNK